MSNIKIPVQAYILGLLPMSNGPAPKPSAQLLKPLQEGFGIPSFWTREEIGEAFRDANGIWAQAEIEFAPVTILTRLESVPSDEDNMWYHLTARLTPKKGVAVAFVGALPPGEGGWGGGQIAIVADPVAGQNGSILAHELGHVLLGINHRDDDRDNLMYGQRNLLARSKDKLDAGQIRDARSGASKL